MVRKRDSFRNLCSSTCRAVLISKRLNFCKEDCVEEARRGFLKKAAIVGAVGAIGAVSATSKQTYSSNGVVVGKSSKKEILYKKTQVWEDYIKSAK